MSFIINEGVTATILQLLTTALCENDSQKDSESSGSVHQELVQQLTQSVDIQAVRQFVRCFLLQSNSTSIRWQAHSLLYSIHRYINHPYLIFIKNSLELIELQVLVTFV